jgi:FkbM family methyltransferase
MFHSLSQLKAAFAAGEISKPDFIEQAHAHFHAMLFKYALDIENTDISSIQINDRRVVMTTRADGIALIVDPSDHRTAPVESLNFNSYEPCESSIIRSFAPHIDTMLDIGANIGWYSLLVTSINKSASIHAFEPIPNTFKRLSDNCSLNQANSIICHNFGFSSETGFFPFYFYPEGSGNASIRNLAAREDAQVIDCELITLSDFCLGLPSSSSIDFIKCDVEGNELFVFQGSTSVLQEHKPILLVELLRKWCAPFGYHPNDMLALMFDIGYSAYGVNAHGGLRSVETITDETEETNFFFVHPESKLSRAIQLFLPVQAPR